MCGIVVGLAFGKLNQRDEAMRQKLLRYFTTELLVATEDRGKDATGAVILFNDGKYVGMKRGEKVSDFLSVFGESNQRYGGLLKVWREHPSPARIYLGHCRAGTGGVKEDNENNHPIKIGNLVGIHNGVIKNDDIIFENLGCKRDGKVDSEAIFRLFDYYTNSGKEPFTLDMIQNVVDRLDGQFAVTLFNADNLYQVPVFRDGRPVEFVLIKQYGILLMVSEMKFWQRIHFRYERSAHYYREVHSINLPSFLDKGDIETKAMQDDTGIIFDLSKKVTKDTEIDDLGESGKMIRSNKKWEKKYTSYSSGSYNYNKGTPHASSSIGTHNSGSTDSDTKKRRVFDKIKKAYVVRIGDKEPDTSKSNTLSVDSTESKSETKEETKSPVEDKKESEKTHVPVKSLKEGEDGFRKDDEKEAASSGKVEIEDRTVYDADKNEVENRKESDVIDLDPKDVEVINEETKENKEDEPNVVEVDMTVNPPEIVEAANQAYESLPSDQKGCGDINDLLDIVEISKERAEELGMALVGNRAIKYGWIQGYIHAAKTMSGKDMTKSQRRESHIAGLKSLVVLLTRYYRREKTANVGSRSKLAQAALDSNKKINMDKLMNIFNSHEKGLLKEINEVISQAGDVVEKN